MDHFWVDVFILVWEFGGPSTTSGWLNKVIWLCSRVCCLTIKHTPPPLLPPLIMVPLCTPLYVCWLCWACSNLPRSYVLPFPLLTVTCSRGALLAATTFILLSCWPACLSSRPPWGPGPPKKIPRLSLYFSVDFFIKLLVSVDWLLGVLCLWFDLIALGYLFLGWELILNMFDT